MMTTTDPRVVAYLQRLEEAAAGLRPERRAELRGRDPRSHRDPARRPGTSPPGTDPVDDVLARLGEPEEIVAAAADDSHVLDPDVHREPVRRRPGFGGLEAAALVLLLIGGFLFLVGWIVGVVLLWMSPRWTVREKILGTLVWPGGLATPVLIGGAATFIVAGPGETCVTTEAEGGALVERCTGATGGPNWLAIALVVAAILAPIAIVWRLGLLASRRVASGVDAGQ